MRMRCNCVKYGGPGGSNVTPGTTKELLCNMKKDNDC